MGSRRAGVLCILVLASLACSVSGQERHPNVLWIMSDDLRPQLGCYGRRQTLSPHIDALAARGMAFTHA